MFPEFRNYETCSHCGAMYDRRTTCVSCALKWASLCEIVRETTKMYNAVWEGRVYADLPVDQPS